MTSSINAAVLLGEDYAQNLHSITNTDKKPSVQNCLV